MKYARCIQINACYLIITDFDFSVYINWACMRVYFFSLSLSACLLLAPLRLWLFFLHIYEEFFVRIFFCVIRIDWPQNYPHNIIIVRSPIQSVNFFCFAAAVFCFGFHFIASSINESQRDREKERKCGVFVVVGLRVIHKSINWSLYKISSFACIYIYKCESTIIHEYKIIKYEFILSLLAEKRTKKKTTEIQMRVHKSKSRERL